MKEKMNHVFDLIFKDDEWLFSHDGLTKRDENARIKIFCFLCLSVICFILSICFYMFKDSFIVLALTNESQFTYTFIFAILVYAIFISLSTFLYHLIYYFFEPNDDDYREKNHKYVICFIFTIITILINSPWAIIVWLIRFVLKLSRMRDLFKYLPMITFGYLFALGILCICLSWMPGWLDAVFVQRKLYDDPYISTKTCLYLVVFLSVIIFKLVLLSNKKIMFKLHKVDKNSLVYTNIDSQIDLLNDYFSLVLTFVLKALDFADDDKIIIDALFYSISILAMISSVRKKANEMGA